MAREYFYRSGEYLDRLRSVSNNWWVFASKNWKEQKVCYNYRYSSLRARRTLVGLAQMVRASDCGPEGRRFDPDIPPHEMVPA